MEKTHLKTGIFGGTFNPVHIGHLALANYLCEYEDLDEVWFLVTPQNPFKKDIRLLDDRIRLEMVKTAIENGQNLIVEGGYIPFGWEESFPPEYLKEIRY